MIRVSFSLFLSLSVFCYFTLLLILKNYFIIIFFFHENYFYFSCSGMFRNVPACSAMFRVPGFIDALSNTGKDFVSNSYVSICMSDPSERQHRKPRDSFVKI